MSTVTLKYKCQCTKDADGNFLLFPLTNCESCKGTGNIENKFMGVDSIDVMED